MKKALYWVLIAIFSIVFLISAFILGRYLINSYNYKQQLSGLQQMHTTPETRPSVSLRQPTSATSGSTAPTVPSGPDIPSLPVDPTDPSAPTNPIVVPTEPNVPDNSGMLPELAGLYRLNRDMVGWIYIEDTNINNPVMQRKQDKDYYLYRDFYKDYDENGSLYVREACDVFEPSDVVTIYGHSMLNGNMFGNLQKYKQNQFFNAHPLIYFDTLYERHVYQVVCVFRTSAEYGVGFPYHLYDNFADEAEFREFIQGVRGLAIQDSGIAVHYGDKFIQLSTCEDAPIENGRLVLLAVRIS